MSRSNGPATQPGTQPGGWPHARTTTQPGQHQGYEQDSQGRWPAQGQMPQGQMPHGHGAHGQPTAYGGHAAQPGYVAAGYPAHAAPAYPASAPQQPAPTYQPASQGHDAYGRPAPGGGQSYGAQPAYAPQFDAYVPPSQGQGAARYPGGGTTGGHPAQELSSLQRHPAPAPAALPELRGAHYDSPQPFDQWAGAGYAPERTAAPDQRGYDLGGYAPAQPAMPSLEPGHVDRGGDWSQRDGAGVDIYGQPLGYAQPAYPTEYQGDYQDPYRHGEAGGFGTAPLRDPHGYAQPGAGHGANFGHQAQHGQGHAGPDYGEPVPQGYAASGHPLQTRAAPGAGGEIEPAYQHQHEDGGELEFEEPKPARRWGLIAASLVGAVAVGAGVAYGYRMVTGQSGGAATPVVKSASAPAKIKPADPGGKQFPHADSKIMGRLNDQGAPAAATGPAPTPPPSTTASDADQGGARKVQTMVIGRDGTIVPNAPPAEAPKVAAAPQAVAVPGMTIVDGFGGRPPSAALANGAPPPAAGLGGPPVAAPPAAARPVVVNPPVAAPSARPVVTAKAPPPVAEAEAPAVAAKPATPAAPKVAVPKKVAAASPPPASASAGASAAAAGANGYVAVLASVPASQKSSMDALKQFADMQQKYGTALANKTPEVREANLGDKGTYHRLLVGPPGSREQAGQLCTQLKAAGYGSCWVTAY